MRTLLISSFIYLCISLLLSIHAIEASDVTNEALLSYADAAEAMAIANQWHQSQKKVKSFVTSREVVFEFSKDNIKMIPLPEDKMVVAIAPYINQTHQ